jgi:peptidyl-prolyl cis-trans isomerase C
MPRVDVLRDTFEQSRKQPRYIKSWSDAMLIFLPLTIFSFAYWSQAPAGGLKPSVPTPATAPQAAPPSKPPIAAPAAKGAVMVQPGVPRVTPPAVSPVKAAAAKAAIAQPPKPAVPGQPPVLTIGAERLTQAQFESLIKALPPEVQAQLATPQAKREFAKQYGEVRALATDARKKMALDPQFRAQGELQMDQALANVLLRETAKVTDASMRQYFDEHKGEFETSNGRHILIRFKTSPVALKPNQKDLTEEEALAKAADIGKQLAGGADFAEIARKESDDAGSGAAGGALGDFPRGMMVPAFDQAAFSLPVGQVSEPVKTQFGYHIIQIQSRKSKAFEEAKADIEKRQKPEMMRKAVEDLKGKYKIVLDEAYFGKD